MSDKYIIPKRLDDPELIGLWTLDEFLAMVVPFAWGILTQHILLGLTGALVAWFGLRKAKGGRASAWVIHLAYWHLPSGFVGLKITPPSHCRLLAG